ncbi:uncharacterized protein [Notamacropus eugenii]|uniref:uncharacterized protein n=1 Tax=Notamacropus eugenii TaxID=9315 RepID=UPI003B681C62
MASRARVQMTTTESFESLPRGRAEHITSSDETIDGTGQLKSQRLDLQRSMRTSVHKRVRVKLDLVLTGYSMIQSIPRDTKEIQSKHAAPKRKQKGKAGKAGGSPDTGAGPRKKPGAQEVRAEGLRKAASRAGSRGAASDDLAGVLVPGFVHRGELQGKRAHGDFLHALRRGRGGHGEGPAGPRPHTRGPSRRPGPPATRSRAATPRTADAPSRFARDFTSNAIDARAEPGKGRGEREFKATSAGPTVTSVLRFPPQILKAFSPRLPRWAERWWIPPSDWASATPAPARKPPSDCFRACVQRIPASRGPSNRRGFSSDSALSPRPSPEVKMTRRHGPGDRRGGHLSLGSGLERAERTRGQRAGAAASPGRVRAFLGRRLHGPRGDPSQRGAWLGGGRHAWPWRPAATAPAEFVQPPRTLAYAGGNRPRRPLSTCQTAFPPWPLGS